MATSRVVPPASRRTDTRAGARRARTTVGAAELEQRSVLRAQRVAVERRRLLTLWLFMASPLVWVPGGFTRFVFPKLLVVALAWIVATTLPRERRLPRSVTATLWVGVALVTAAALAGQTPVASLVGRWPRYEGLPVLALYAASVWIGARVVGRGLIRATHLAHALSVMSVILAVFSVADALGHSPLSPATVGRSGSLLGNATDQGLVAMMAAVVVLAVLVERFDPLLLAGALGAVATVSLSGSRTSIALTVAGAAGVFLVRRQAHEAGLDRRLYAYIGGLLTTLVVVAVAVPVTRDRLLDGATGSGRVLQWRLTLHLVADHPWLGLGPSRYVDAFGTYESAAFVRFTGPSTIADSPHDLLLQTTVAGGIPLLACLLVLVVLACRQALRMLAAHPEAWGPAIAATAYGVAMLANFTAAGSTCLAAFLAGVVLAEPVTAPVDAERSPYDVWSSRVTGAVGVVLAVVMAMSCVGEVLLAHGVSAASRGEARLGRGDVDSAQAWRPFDGDVSMLGAQAMAGAADAGAPAAAPAAIALAQSALRRTPDSYDARVAEGVGLIARGRLASAETVLDAAVESFPHRPDAYVQRAVAQVGSGDVRGALADLDIAATIEPRSPIPARLRQQVESLGKAGG